MHYSATPESDYELKPEHFLLADTGGNYYEGTTDLTRTVALGPVSDELKTHFTAVARGMMNLAKSKISIWLPEIVNVISRKKNLYGL